MWLVPKIILESHEPCSSRRFHVRIKSSHPSVPVMRHHQWLYANKVNICGIMKSTCCLFIAKCCKWTFRCSQIGGHGVRERKLENRLRLYSWPDGWIKQSRSAITICHSVCIIKPLNGISQLDMRRHVAKNARIIVNFNTFTSIAFHRRGGRLLLAVYQWTLHTRANIRIHV